MNPNATVVYRGQLHTELSRIDFLVDAASDAFGELRFAYLAPPGATPSDAVEDFLGHHPTIIDAVRIPASTGELPPARRTMRSLLKAAPGAPTVMIGFSTRQFVGTMQGQPLAWCVNGIPEERLLHHDDARARALVRLAWWFAGRGRSPDLVVTVSDPMQDLVGQRLRTKRSVVVPNAVDLETFQARTVASEADRPFLVYEGGGSPWQSLDRLAGVWSEVHGLDSGVRFRVISADDRTRVLGRELPADAIDYCVGTTHDDVAALLGQCQLGFLLRQPSLVNRVAWPMKFGEYLAAGAGVCATRIGWQIEEVIEQHDAGLIVDWEDDDRTIARQITTYLAEHPSPATGVRAAAESLATAPWRARLAGELRSLTR